MEGGSGAGVSTSIACSFDGKIVYALDYDSIYKSEDFGENWKMINPNSKK